MMKNPCWTAFAQVVASTAVAERVKYCAPSRYQRICSGLTLRSYSIAYVWKPGLAAGAGLLAAAESGGFVARPAGGGAAVQGAPHRAAPVDVLEDVDLADAGPVRGTDRAGRLAEHPERRPVAGAVGGGDVRLLDRGLDPQDAAGRGGEVGALGLDPAGGPVAGLVTHRGDGKVTGAVQGDVGGAVRHRLDLAGAPVRGPAGVAVTGGVEPARGVDAGTCGAGEVVAPHRGEPGGCCGDVGPDRSLARQQVGDHSQERRHDHQGKGPTVEQSAGKTLPEREPLPEWGMLPERLRL